MNNTGIRCPWCGEEMRKGGAWADERTTVYWFVCSDDFCRSESPYRDTEEEAYSAAMARCVEPLKPMTLDELFEFCDTHDYMEPIFIVGKGAVGLGTGWGWAGVFKAEFLPMEQYIKGYPDEWEAWLRRPTDDDLAAARNVINT